MKGTKSHYLYLSAIHLGMLLAFGSTGAQESEGQIEEIIVTATFREASLQETPIAITAITGDILENRAQTNLYEVANQAPNVTLKRGGQARSGMIAFIRGVGQYDFIAALEPGVGVYVDDVYYSQLTGSLLELLDVDRVEVLRGPQGTLAGRNSIGGAVKLYTKKPGEDNDGFARVGFGSYDQSTSGLPVG
jgi:iron complex outermembrane receptor protein